jgi:hypothetical protein
MMENNRIAMGYVAFATGNRANDRLKLEGYITARQQEAKVRGLKAMKGRYGSFFWVDEFGDPREDQSQEEDELEMSEQM